MRPLLLLAAASTLFATPPQEFDSYAVITVMVPMRDSTRLATDIYRPARGGIALGGRFPVIVTRSPYNKNGERRKAIQFAQRGYVFIAQDCRGRFASEGHLIPLVNEGRDGYDTIEWAAAQTWSNGKVATTGASYLAMDQLAAALEQPKHLVAMYIAVGAENFYFDSAYRGGVPSLGWPVWLLLMAATSPQAAHDPKTAESLNNLVKHPAPWFAQSREQRGEVFRNFPDEMTAYKDFYAHPLFDAYWKQKGFDIADYYAQMKDIPMLFVSGWYDTFADATLENFTELSRRQNTPKKLLMGPWPHGYGKSACGDAAFGIEANLDEPALWFDWFDHWLKNKPFTMIPAQPVRYYRMGGGAGFKEGKLLPGGRWRNSLSWPPTGEKPQRLYLHGEGRLDEAAPGSEQAQTYIYRPDNPVPTRGGRYNAACIQNQAGLEKRADVLSFSTTPLNAAMDITGMIRATLWISSDAPSTDFTAKLMDVYPDGYAMNFADGQIRASDRDGFTRSEPLKPGKIYRVEIDLGSASNLVARGHRVRLDISSSNYPKLEPGASEARNTLYHDTGHASFVELPVVR
ncbi:MAG TPA: CocE/NonD family hydrolase [Bryobacteraceae bacterium]|nr:CocE/NonD family hydrolase [Bryobacteraceae bacterium]